MSDIESNAVDTYMLHIKGKAGDTSMTDNLCKTDNMITLDIIKIEHLNKSFGDVKAVNDLSFRVKKGELFAFLGVNGAGKSTTISII